MDASREIKVTTDGDLILEIDCGGVWAKRVSFMSTRVITTARDAADQDTKEPNWDNECSA